MAKIEIKSNGFMGKVFVDGKEIEVRKASYEISAGNIPVVKLELVGTDEVSISANGVIPELPDVFKPFYKKIETTE